jgi:hypothetical protein
MGDGGSWFYVLWICVSGWTRRILCVFRRSLSVWGWYYDIIHNIRIYAALCVVHCSVVLTWWPYSSPVFLNLLLLAAPFGVIYLCGPVPILRKHCFLLKINYFISTLLIYILDYIYITLICTIVFFLIYCLGITHCLLIEVKLFC